MSDIKNEWRRFSEEKPEAGEVKKRGIWFGSEEHQDTYYFDVMPLKCPGWSHWMYATKPQPPPKPAVEVALEKGGAPDFITELRDLINRRSMENRSNTPDFILAHYLDRARMPTETEMDAFHRGQEAFKRESPLDANPFVGLNEKLADFWSFGWHSEAHPSKRDEEGKK